MAAFCEGIDSVFAVGNFRQMLHLFYAHYNKLKNNGLEDILDEAKVSGQNNYVKKTDKSAKSCD